MRKELGILHFFVNGVDQGPAAFNVPEHVFGIIGELLYFFIYLPPWLNERDNSPSLSRGKP